MTLNNAVNHSGHGEHSEKQGLDACRPSTNEVSRATGLKSKYFAVAAVPQGDLLRGMIAVVELGLLG